MRSVIFLDAVATATIGEATPVSNPERLIAVTASLTAGSATVDIECTVDPSWLHSPATAVWQAVATLTLSGAGDKASFRDVLPCLAVRARTTAVTTGPVSVWGVL
jgi:hypothetical protein